MFGDGHLCKNERLMLSYGFMKYIMHTFCISILYINVRRYKRWLITKITDCRPIPVDSDLNPRCAIVTRNENYHTSMRTSNRLIDESSIFQWCSEYNIDVTDVSRVDNFETSCLSFFHNSDSVRFTRVIVNESVIEDTHHSSERLTSTIKPSQFVLLLGPPA